VQLLLTAMSKICILFVQSYFTRHHNASDKSKFSNFLAHNIVCSSSVPILQSLIRVNIYSIDAVTH